MTEPILNNSTSFPQGATHAESVLERRNSAFRILYDTVFEIEGAGEEDVYRILCRNMRRLCGGWYAALGVFDYNRNVLRFQAADREESESSIIQAVQPGSIVVLPKSTQECFLHERVHPCERRADCPAGCLGMMEFAAQGITADAYRLSCVQDGQLVAAGMVWMRAGQKLHMQDILDTYLNLTGMILQRVQATLALRDSEELYRNLIEATDTGYLIIDLDGGVIDANARYVHMTGHSSRRDILGKNVADWTAPAFFPDWIEALRSCAQLGSVRHVETAYRHSDGRNLPVEVNASKVDIHGQSRILALCSDTTERKVLENHLAQSQKLEAIGQLASGIAHEINTPIQYIGDNVRFLQESLQDVFALLNRYNHLLEAAKGGVSDTEEVMAMEKALNETDVSYLAEEMPLAVRQSLEGVQRVAEIIRAMKEFSRPGETSLAAMDLNKALDSTIVVSRNEWKYVAEIQRQFEYPLPPVQCTAGEINQVFLNLIINAAHAIADVVGDEGKQKGVITIGTRRDGDWVEVRISDTGAGIPEGIRDRIFDPFFTTKDVGKGTGQGLSMSRSVVSNHGGKIYFESEYGKGSTFYVRLPLASMDTGMLPSSEEKFHVG